METTAASAGAARTMKRFYPQWTAENMAAPSIPASSEPIQGADDAGFIEFVLSSNWIMRPDGLRELYAKIREHIPAPEITYESYLGCFRVRCRNGGEEQVVTLINRFMDEIVRSELAKVPEEKRIGLFGGDDSNKIRHISEWRLAHIDEKEQEAYEVFSYPQAIMAMPFRGTWRVPQEAVERFVTIRKLFVTLDPVATLATSTHCTVAKGSDGVSLHFGAKSEDDIKEAKKKMDNLMKYYDLPSCVGSTQANLLYAEGEEGEAELRYLFYLNRRFVTTVFLDPREFQLPNDYGKVFVKGCCVRLVTYNKPHDTNQPMLSVTFSPAISEDKVSEPYQDFNNWGFAAKEREITEDMSSVPQQLMVQTSDALKRVNPQAAPHVLEWANNLPPPTEYSSEKPNNEAPINGRVVPDLLVLNANASLPGAALQSTQAIGSFSQNLGRENRGNTFTPSRSEVSGQHTSSAKPQNHQPKHAWGHVNRAPIYQSRSSMAPSPPTTNASSQLAQKKDQILQPLHGHWSPFSTRRTPPSNLDRLPGSDHADSTTLSAQRSDLEPLRKAFGGLSVAPRRDESNVYGAEQSGPNEAALLPMQRENTFPDDPFASPGGSESTSVPLRHGADGIMALKQPGSETESGDLLGLSPEKPPSMMAPLIPTPRIASSEQHSRQFHSTMNQQSSLQAGRQSHLVSEQQTDEISSTMNAQAGMRSAPYDNLQSCLTDSFEQDYSDFPPHMSGLPDPLMMKVYGHMSTILEPLRLFQGSVTLKAEIGRFILTKINSQHISMPDFSHNKAKSIEDMEKSLARHTDVRDQWFTKILTLSGGDANYMVNQSQDGHSSSKMWLCKKREVFYEFWCMTRGESGKKHYFFLNINANDFSYNLRAQDTKISRVSVHCMKRQFDFRLVVESAHDIEKNCGNFAKEVIASLKVQPQDGGPPIISFTNHQDWGVQTKTVRIRHVGTYGCTVRDCALEIVQVQNMKVRRVGKGNHWHLDYVPDLSGTPRDGFFPLWFEASIRSNTADMAFAENRGLGFGDEARWTPEGLKSSGVFDDLVQSATDVVKQMDGVGYWCNNQQDSMKHGEPPRNQADQRRQEQVQGTESYW